MHRLNKRVEKLQRARIAIYYRNTYYRLNSSNGEQIGALFKEITECICDYHKVIQYAHLSGRTYLSCQIVFRWGTFPGTASAVAARIARHCSDTQTGHSICIPSAYAQDHALTQGLFSDSVVMHSEYIPRGEEPKFSTAADLILKGSDDE